LKTGIVICTRLNSSRIHQKPLQMINGKTVIEHLVDRCIKTGITTIIACPNTDFKSYKSLGIPMTTGHDNDPLRRMWMCAEWKELDHVIRITHDKILIDPDTIIDALDKYMKGDHDYLYSNQFTDGSAFEIISKRALDKAVETFNNVEHVSYAIKSVTDNRLFYSVPENLRSDYRFLIDYPEDLTLMRLVFNQLGNDCTLEDAIEFMKENRWAREINKLPEVTIYTCGYNAEQYLDHCIGSVIDQDHYLDTEYLLIDDHSSDSTFKKMTKAMVEWRNIKVIRNSENLGLASSSNVALANARGKYIIRLDADDFFMNSESVSDLYDKIRMSTADVVYPNNYFGSLDKVQKGSECHHVGGALFDKRALNHIKFTDKLRGHDSLDVFLRAKDQ